MCVLEMKKADGIDKSGQLLCKMESIKTNSKQKWMRNTCIKNK